MLDIIRTSAFLRKEITEVLRQPRLIAALVLGPFLILLLFGLGYRNEARAVRTLFVADQNSELAKQIEQIAPNISPQLIYIGITGSEPEALSKLQSGLVDMVVVVPDNAYQTISNNQQASFTIYQNEIDPAQVSYIEYLGQVYVNEVNRRILSSVAEQGQTSAGSLKDNIAAARQNNQAMKQALQQGNVVEARNQQRLLQSNISSVSVAVGASVGLLSGVQQNVGPGSQTGNAGDIAKLLQEIQGNSVSREDIPATGGSFSAEIQQLDQQDQKLAQLETKLAQFQSISPDVLTRPFTVKVLSLSPLKFTPTNFFTPGVIILLLQHVVITVAALSIVRERRAGTMELFRVSPITAGQALIGKYISYMIFGAIIALVLSLLLHYGLNAPMLGSWTNVSIVLLVLLFSALGIGFFISLMADTESQAVQFAMIALLLSVFFSGFLLDLRYLAGPVRIISWLLPATYGTVMLQGIMLRGSGIPLLLLGGMFAIGVFFFVLSWLLMRRQMAHE